MPYIKQEDRDELARQDRLVLFPRIDTAGQLNYEFTLKIIRYLDTHGLSYQTCNDIVGALDNAKSEFKRRVQDPYEDKKILDNGDVYPIIYLGQ